MPDEKAWKELLPPEGHEKVGEEGWKLLEAVVADKDKLGLPKKWQRHYELRKNKQWKQQTQGGINLVTANLIYTHIQRVTNTMTDNDPTFNIVQMATDDGQGEIFTNLQKAAESWWTDTEQSDDFARSVTGGETYGITIEKVIFNPDLEMSINEAGQIEPIGEAETIIVDPYHFGVYPVKMVDPKKLQQAEAVLHYFPMSVRTVKRTWGAAAKDVKPDSDLMKEMGEARREVSAGNQSEGRMLVSLATVAKTLLNWGQDKAAKEDEETIVCEIWLRDRSDSQKYPGNIRRVTLCNGGKIVLEDRPNPSINSELWAKRPTEVVKTYLFDKFPFTAANSIPDTSNFWGMDDLDQIEQIQLEINKAISQLILFKDRAARQKLINPKTSGVENEEFTNASGVIRPVNSQEGTAIHWLGAPESNVDIAAMIPILKDLFFLIVGTFDLDQAQVGKDVIAYKAIAALMERAATMMRGKIRSYNRMIRERGRMYLSHVMNFYSEERWITMMDPATGQMVAKQIPQGTSMIVPAKLTVVSGSTLPVSRVQRREEAIGLADKGAIDQQALLEALDYPNRNDIIKRMQAGPMGSAMQKLSAMGIPPEILEIMGQVMTMDDKEFQKVAKSGELPTFEDIVAVAMQGGGQAPDPAKQGEAMEQQAKAQKMGAETALIAEKILTERVKQQQIIAGIKYDDEMMAIERAKIVAELEHTARASEREDVKTAHAIVTGAKSEQREDERVGIEREKVKGQGPYAERGAKSNNKAQ